MKTVFNTTDGILAGKAESPLPLEVIPNHMGINLCSVEGISHTRQADAQLVSLTIHFIPKSEDDKT